MRKIFLKWKVVCIIYLKCMEYSKIFLWINYKVLMLKFLCYCEISFVFLWNGVYYGRNFYCWENKKGMLFVFMYISVLYFYYKYY